MNLKKSGFLVSVIFALVFLSIAVSQVSAAYFPLGTAKCSILPGDPATSTEYCPSCPVANARCDHKPTPGQSGCACADEICQQFINNDTCDWTEGVHICKAVCNDIPSLAYCSQVAKTKALGIGLPIPDGGIRYPFVILQDYVPPGGCCNRNASYNECKNAHCLKPSSCKSRYQCCLLAGETGCTVDADCCYSSEKCIGGTCQTCRKAYEKCGSGLPACCSGYYCSWWSKTCTPRRIGGGGGGRAYLLDVTTMVAVAVVIALGALAIVFGVMKLTKKKKR